MKRISDDELYYAREIERLQRDKNHYFEQLQAARKDNAALREGLGMMLKRFGTCLSVISPSGVEVLTAEMEMARCHRCDPCLAREIWENRCK